MLGVRRIDEQISRRDVNFTMDSKRIGDVTKLDEDDVNLDKTQPDLS